MGILHCTVDVVDSEHRWQYSVAVAKSSHCIERLHFSLSLFKDETHLGVRPSLDYPTFAMTISETAIRQLQLPANTASYHSLKL